MDDDKQGTEIHGTNPGSLDSLIADDSSASLPSQKQSSKQDYLKEYNITVTLPPFSHYYEQIMDNPFVHGVRFNSATKTRRQANKIMRFYKDYSASDPEHKNIWLDLKCRQLRVKKDTNIPSDYLELTHKIKVNTPTEVIFNDGEASAMLIQVVDGNKLRFDSKTPSLHFGKGASLNIIDDSFETEGFFTKKDKKYIKAAKRNDMHKYMLSFVEHESDIEELLAIDPQAEIVAKIESKKGLEFVRDSYPKYKDKVRLMAATGDLYVEVDSPHRISYALEKIIKADPEAIVASRILSSCAKPDKMPECSEILAVKYMLSLGYKNFMLGDEFCPDRFDLDNHRYTSQSSLPLRSALGLFEAIIKDHYDSQKASVLPAARTDGLVDAKVKA